MTTTISVTFNPAVEERVPVVSFHAALLIECERMTATMAYNEEIGFYYWPWIHVDEIVPEGINECGICTNGARWIAEKFGGYVAGYPIPWSDDQELIGAHCGGHDFAIVGNYLVDWWAWEYEEAITVPVLHLLDDAKVIEHRYKPRDEWQLNKFCDFRTRATARSLNQIERSIPNEKQLTAT